METSSPSPSNIVATAMSTANLTPTADSPQPQGPTMKVEPSSPHIRITSPTPQPSSGTVTCTKVENMDVSDHHIPTHMLHKQPSMDSDTQSQRSGSSPLSINVSRFREENLEKPVLLINEPRTEAKESHVVTMSSPHNYQPTTNGETRLQPPMVLYNNERRELMSGILPVNMMLSKDYKGVEPEFEKPKEDSTYPITCGNNKGDLVWKKFVCPGINAKCVKCGDNWFTPKEFVSFAGKSTLKDWKRAIRINGIMLRKMIENGELNYYEHENNCSNQCRSNKSSSFDNST
uniref:SAND domain-containing protein n=1 Tax=Ciona savignyi TaxID=51511 RepID=H2Y5H6_CIOSA